MIRRFTCILCPKGCPLTVQIPENGTIQESLLSVTGNSCQRGRVYACQEIIAPTRVLTSTVRVLSGIHPRVPVKTSRPVAKEQLLDIMKHIHALQVTAPIQTGDILFKNVSNSGADILATKNIPKAE